VAGDAGLSLLFVAGGAGPSSLFACGGTGPSFAICGAGPSSSTAGGVAGPSSFFVGGGAGCWLHCSWVVVVCPHWFSCSMAPITVVVVLSLLEGEGGGSFMSADTPSVVVLHWRPASFPHAVIVCPHNHVSSSLSHVPHHCCVSSPCRCPLPSSSLSHNVVAVPSL